MSDAASADRILVDFDPEAAAEALLGEPDLGISSRNEILSNFVNFSSSFQVLRRPSRHHQLHGQQHLAPLFH